MYCEMEERKEQKETEETTVCTVVAHGGAAVVLLSSWHEQRWHSRLSLYTLLYTCYTLRHNAELQSS